MFVQSRSSLLRKSTFYFNVHSRFEIVDWFLNVTYIKNCSRYIDFHLICWFIRYIFYFNFYLILQKFDGSALVCDNELFAISHLTICTYSKINYNNVGSYYDWIKEVTNSTINSKVAMIGEKKDSSSNDYTTLSL